MTVKAVRLVASAVLACLVAVAGAAPTSAATVSCSSTTPVAERPLLRKGDRGSCVTVLQTLLGSRGYPVGVSGTYGDTTELAVRRFQHDHVGLSIDGRVGPASWAALVEGGTAYSIAKGPNRSEKVVLSFDDCPVDLAAFEATVEGAQQLGIALALLPTGECLEAGRFDAASARGHGHYVFNHSVTHARLTELSTKKAYAELGAPGVVTSYGRPPYGAYDTETVRNAYALRAMRIWTWTLDTRDWEAKSTTEVVDLVVANAKPGDTVLMHMKWNAFNTAALGRIKAGLEDRGVMVCANAGGTTAVSPADIC